MTDIRMDKKSGKTIYVVEKEEFNSSPLMNISIAKDLDYSNIPLNAAQNNNLGTVMVLPDNTNILFRDINVQNLIDKASKEGLYEKDISKPMDAEVSLVMSKGGVHFFAIFSNNTHYFKTDFMPAGNKCELLPITEHSQIFDPAIVSCTQSSYIDITGIRKPLLGEYSVTFSISDDQYHLAYNENQKLKNQCNTGEVSYEAFMNQDNKKENCISSLERVLKAIDFEHSFIKYFLDYQLIFDEKIPAQYIYQYKHDNPFATDTVDAIISNLPYNSAILLAVVAPIVTIPILGAAGLGFFVASMDSEDEEYHCSNSIDSTEILTHIEEEFSQQIIGDSCILS